jgi:deferrochelatase/peroxidase EfeB
MQLQGKESGGVEQLVGHSDANGRDAPFQDLSVLMANGQPTPKEHFGYTDGISETFFRGMTEPANLIGGGKPAGSDKDPASPDGWLPLETGEFLLGHKDEAFEYPEAPIPNLLARNGTFVAYRKLHQNVGTFHRFVEEMGKRYPGGSEELSAKIVGRWKNGAPLATFPNKADADAFGAKVEQATREFLTAAPDAKPQAKARLDALRSQLVGFNFQKDISGANCPLGAHIRRINPRGSLDFGRDAFNTFGALINRRRIIRRGLPYGEVTDPSRDDGNHGIVILVHNASLRRQFEFVQQQWINFGNDFKLGNDKDPLLGNHNDDGRMTIQADSKGSKPPFFCGGIPRFVETRGGDYFFVPSLTALNLIARGLVDPT